MPRNPLDVLAQQLVAMTVMDRWTVGGPARARSRGRRRSRRCRARSSRACSACSRAPTHRTSSPSSSRGSSGTASPTRRGPARRAGRRRHERRDDPRSRAVRGVHGGRGRHARPARRRARRGDGLRAPRRDARRRHRARREQLAGPRHHARPGDGEPAPGVPGKLPFWKGDAVGRPVELGRAHRRVPRRDGGRAGARREGRGGDATQRLREHHDLDERAAENLVAYLEDEREATGALPTDKRDRGGAVPRRAGRLAAGAPDARSAGGSTRPLSLAIESRLRERLGMEVQTIWSDDGIAIRLPEGRGQPRRRRGAAVPGRGRGRGPRRRAVANSALFASRFRENAARALLLPRRRPGARTPLWQQRQRAADLLPVASRYGSFPILVETYRECLSRRLRPRRAARGPRRHRAPRDRRARRRDRQGEAVREQPAVRLRRRLHVRRRHAAGRATGGRAHAGPRPAPRAARPGGAPRAARPRCARRPRAVAPGARRGPARRRRSTRSTTCCGGWATCPPTRWRPGPTGGAPVADPWLAELEAARRAVRVRIAGDERWIAIEDVARYRDGVGVAAPVGVPEAFLGPAAGALEGLLARFARTHGPFLTPDPARRWGLPAGVVGDALERLLANGSLLRGEFRPGGAEREWCDPEVLRLLRRRSLARLRREVEPVDPAALGRFLPGVAGRGARRRAGRDAAPFRGTAALERLAEVVDQLAGVADPGVRAGARRPAGPRARLPAAAARRARGAGRGRLGRARQPRPRRRADRAVPARPRGPAAGRAAGWRRAARERAPRRDPRAPGPPGRELLSRAPRRGRRRVGPR